MKTNFRDIYEKDGGILWEQDPVKHREMAKNLLPVFNARYFRVQDSILQEYTDLLIGRTKAQGGGGSGIKLRVVKVLSTHI